MRIIQISPDFYPVPPKNYGGIERVIFDLCEELVKKGHEVYLYALRGSTSSANIIPYEHICPNPHAIPQSVAKTLPKNIDIIHDHTHASIMKQSTLKIPTVYTIHDHLNHSVTNPIYLCKRALEAVGGNQGFYVYNGIELSEYEFCEQKDDYLLFIGAVSWHKGIDHVLDIAEKTGQKLIVAGPIFDHDYYNKNLKPRIIVNSNIQYIGEVGGKDRQNLLKHARCMLFPTLWEEPFGLVMIEAMACGTPVIALANGAVPEVMKGFPDLICYSVDEMIKKVLNWILPNPKLLREYVANNFTASMMADGYIKVYKEVINQ